MDVILVVCGLPGSGKSTLCCDLKKALLDAHSHAVCHIVHFDNFYSTSATSVASSSLFANENCEGSQVNQRSLWKQQRSNALSNIKDILDKPTQEDTQIR